MTDEIFKNDGKICTKCPPTGFWGCGLRIFRQIYKIQYGEFEINEIFKNYGRISTNRPRTGF